MTNIQLKRGATETVVPPLSPGEPAMLGKHLFVADAGGNAVKMSNAEDLTAHAGDGTAHVAAAERSLWSAKAAPAAAVSAVLTAAGWGGSGPYIQTVALPGLTTTKSGQVGLSPTATMEQRGVARDALLSVTGQAQDSLEVTADGEKPGVDLPLAVLLLG